MRDPKWIADELARLSREADALLPDLEEMDHDERWLMAGGSWGLAEEGAQVLRMASDYIREALDPTDKGQANWKLRTAVVPPPS